MNLSELYVTASEGLVSLIGGSHGLAHVQAGLTIYVGMQFVSRNRRASEQGVLAVLGLELANEIMEAAHYGSMRWADTCGDIAMTMLWPSILYIASRHRRRRWEKAFSSDPAPGVSFS